MIIKANKFLGDNVHAYMIIKNIKDAGYPASLIVNEAYKSLFDSKYLIDDSSEITYDFAKPSHGFKYLTHKDLHVRDDIIKNFHDIKPVSSPLQIRPYKFNKPTVVVCNRSKPFKVWNGNWQLIVAYLGDLGYSAIFDSPRYSLEEITSYIAGSAFVISIDTGLLHIADAYNKKIIGLYGKQLNRFAPYTDKSFCIEHPLQTLEPSMIMDQIKIIHNFHGCN
jgi:hypothetical protein